jgi:hypothetical protein
VLGSRPPARRGRPVFDHAEVVVDGHGVARDHVGTDPAPLRGERRRESVLARDRLDVGAVGSGAHSLEDGLTDGEAGVEQVDHVRVDHQVAAVATVGEVDTVRLADVCERAAVDGLLPHRLSGSRSTDESMR